MDACLSPSEMDRLARGELRGAARARSESHLQRCVACRTRLEAHRPAPAPTAAAPAPAPVHAADQVPWRHPAPPDDAIEGFRLLEELHRGGQGVVYRALDEARGEVVALKVLREGPFATPDQRLRFERESDLARGLDHPLIVAPLASGVSRGRPYHVMPFIEGLNLDAWAREAEPPLRRRLEVFRDACDAVAHAHSRGVVHRDLKPSNILVDARGRPHVVDFGVAKSSVPGGSLPLTVTGEFVGTLSHASPEQAKGDPRLVDERTDVYSLGVIAYELLTGSMPYPVTGAPADVLEHVLRTEPRHPRAVNPSLDEQLAAIVLRALAKEPERRYASVASLRDDIAAYLDGLPVGARPDSAWDLLARAARRHRAAFAVASAFALGLAVVAVLASVQARRFQLQRDRAEAAEAEARSRARELEAATELARRQSYSANVLAADLALRLGRVSAARRRLDACPEDLRGWEWRHLARTVDASEASVPAGDAPVLALGALPDGRAWRATRTRLDALDPATLAVLESYPVPDVPRPDQAAQVEILAVSPDASLLALRWDDASWQRMGAPGRAVLVTDRQGRIQAILEGAAWRPDRAAFSGDGRRLVATTSESYDASPRAWSTLTGQSRRFLSRAGGGPEGASPVAFSPDGGLLVEGGSDGTLRCWDAESGELAWEAAAHARRVTTVAWSADGSRVVGGAADGSVSIHPRTPSSAPAPAAPTLVMAAAVRSVALDRLGTRVAAGDDDGDVAAWDLASGRSLLRVRGHEAPVLSVAFAGADDSLVSGAGDGSLQRWSAREGAGPAPLVPLSEPTALAFDADGMRLAVASASGLIRVLEAATGSVVAEWRDDEGAVTALGFTPDGSRLVTAGGSGAAQPRSVRLWDLAASPPVGRALGAVPDARAVAFPGDGLVAVVGDPGVVAAWTLDGEPVASLELPPSPGCVATAARQPGAPEAVLTGWSQGRARWLAMRDGQAVPADAPSCAGGSEEATLGGACALFVPLATGGSPLLAASAAGSLQTCAGPDAAGLQSLPLGATALTWSQDGDRLFAGDAHGLIVVLQAHPLEPLLALDAHAGAVIAVAASPDGDLLASAGPDGIRLHRAR